MTILSGKARLAGITGWPVGHSRSPRLHGFWLERYGVDGAYVPLPIEPAQFADRDPWPDAAGFAGVNVHHPAQGGGVRDLRHRRRVGPSRRRRQHAGVRGRAASAAATPTAGASWRTCERNGVDPAAGPALILGAGGSARAIAAVLLDLGVRVTVANRTPRAGRASWPRELPGLEVIDWDRRDDALADHALLVNTTSLGMAGQPPLEIDLDRAGAGLTVVRHRLRAAGNAAAGRRAQRAGCAASRAWACCCTRRCRASRPGSASIRWWMMICGASSPPICCG